MSETVVIQRLRKSVWAFIARVQLVTLFFPTKMITNHATLSRFDLGSAFANLPPFAS